MSAAGHDSATVLRYPALSPRGHAPVRDPELSELRAFCAAAALGSITAAARAMNVSQPAMSKRLRALEVVTGVQLLVRSPKGVTLTPAGNQLYTAAQRVLTSADNIKQLLQAPEATAVVRLACSPTAAESRIPAALASLVANEPTFSAEVTTANSWVVRELVREARYELGVVAVDNHIPLNDGLRQQVIWSDEVVVVVPRGHRWEELPEIPLDTFLGEPVLERDPWAHSSRLVAVVLEQIGAVRAAPRAQIGSTDALLAAATALCTPAMLSSSTVLDAQFQTRRVTGVRFPRDFALVWHGPVVGLSAPAQALAEQLITVPLAQAS